MLTSSRSLFASRHMWEAEPATAFTSFLLDPAFLELGRKSSRFAGKNAEEGVLRPSSINIYQHMFRRFLRFLAEKNLTVHTVSHTDLMAFLDAGRGKQVRAGERNVYKPLTSTIRVRYLRLLERVFLFLGREPNPARHVCFEIFLAKQAGDKGAIGTDEPTVVLTPEEQARFVAALPMPKLSSSSTRGRPAVPWLVDRDRALMMMVLGAGLTVNEVVGLERDAIGKPEADGSLPITILPCYTAGASREHVALLRPYAVEEVNEWLKLRQTLSLPLETNLLFPTPRGTPLDKTGLYKIVKATFVRAGLAKPRMGGRTLRNTYAVSEVLASDSLELVNELLGHRILKSTELVAKVAKQHRLQTTHTGGSTK